MSNKRITRQVDPLVHRLPPRVVFRQSEAACAGVGSRTLYRLVDRGVVERVGHGLYRRSDAPPVDLDLVEVALRSPMATICLTSALARHGLVDDVPSALDLALPRGSSPVTTVVPVAWHHFDPVTFGLGRALVAVEGSDEQIGLYGMERSIVDVFRTRATSGYETGVHAMRAWLRRPGASPAALMSLAEELPRARGPVRQALEHLL